MKGLLGTGRCFDSAHIPAFAGTTWYVRPDGGTPDQCTGTVDAPVPANPDARAACAFAHPFYVLPPGGRARMAGGDRLVIAPASYRMGVGAPGAERCNAESSYDCVMAAVPSGPDGKHPTRILGVLGRGGILPSLWGAERTWFVVNLSGTNHAEVACLEITDHSDCVEFHGGKLRCEREHPPYGDWAASGILAFDARDVALRSLDIHGLASAGITAGRIADWTIEDVFLTANGLAGWQGDLGGPSSNAGRLRFRRVTIDWNGCGENQQREPIGCWAQSAGGYGDGLGTATTGGDWSFEDCRFISNTADGLDLRYADGSGSVTIDRVWAEGNAGSQLKLRGEATIRDSVVNGTCANFSDQPYTFNVDACRARGSAIALEPVPGRGQHIDHATVTGVSGSLLEVVVPPSTRIGSCRGLLPIDVTNSIWMGPALGPSVPTRVSGRVDSHVVAVPAPTVAFAYRECGGLEGAGAPIRHYRNMIWNLKDYGFEGEGACPAATQNLCVDPLLDGTSLKPRSGSPAIDSAGPGSAIDFAGRGRPLGKGPDRGAFEMR